MRLFLRGSVFLAAAASIAGLALVVRANRPAQQSSLPAITPDTEIAKYSVPPENEPSLTPQQTIELLRRKVKYVFVLYQENRSFDSYFGTFPGADGLFSQPANQTPGFHQPILNTDGTQATLHPFRIGPTEYAADRGDVDHSHAGIVAKLHFVNGAAQMDRYALNEEMRHVRKGNPSLRDKQMGELTMAYEDGDTIPFLWRYANRFVLFDHIFQEMTGPSTPGNLSIIGAQTGATQWMLHPEQVADLTKPYAPGLPVLNDPDPFWGSPRDQTQQGKLPVNPADFPLFSVEYNLTYATLPLTLSGRDLDSITRSDRDPATDLADVKEDVADISGSGKARVPWGWYQEGFDREPTDVVSADPVDAEGRHASYVTHHNSPQYFGYIANNPDMNRSLHGLKDFFDSLDHHKLPRSGVFYVKGGFQNILGLKPANPDPTVQKNFLGDDDHPGYSDSQISEALLAETINKIAHSPYWKSCAIVITWDDSEGYYDHIPPPVRSFGPDGSVITDGARVPLILISPYAAVHKIAHEQGDHASVVKFVDTIFNLKPLADLPDEQKARQIGKAKGLDNEGPFDDQTPDITDLLSAFDPARLAGKAPMLPTSYVEIPEELVHTLPQQGTQSRYGWSQIGVLPEDYRLDIKNEIPPDFNPRP